MMDTSSRTDDQTTSSPGKIERVTSSVEVLAENEARFGMYFSTASTATFSLGLGEPAVAGKGIIVSATTPWNGMIGPVLWSGPVAAIASAPSSNLAVVEV